MEKSLSGGKVVLKKSQRPSGQKNFSQNVRLIGCRQLLSRCDVLVRFRELLEIAVRQPGGHLFPDRGSAVVQACRNRCIEKLKGIPARSARDKYLGFENAKSPAPLLVSFRVEMIGDVRFSRGFCEISAFELALRRLIFGFWCNSRPLSTSAQQETDDQKDWRSQGYVEPFPPAPGPLTIPLVPEPISRRSIVTVRW